MGKLKDFFSKNDANTSALIIGLGKLGDTNINQKNNAEIHISMDDTRRMEIALNSNVGIEIS